jgi:hypothetical protein
MRNLGKNWCTATVSFFVSGSTLIAVNLFFAPANAIDCLAIQNTCLSNITDRQDACREKCDADDAPRGCITACRERANQGREQCTTRATACIEQNTATEAAQNKQKEGLYELQRRANPGTIDCFGNDRSKCRK